MQDIPILQAGTAYDDPYTEETFILVINQGLYFGDNLPNSLINPNQMRANVLEVDDVPKTSIAGSIKVNTFNLHP
jgi:hypothetical protein